MSTTDRTTEPAIERVTPAEVDALTASLFGSLLTVEEAGRILGVTRDSVYRYISDGTLPGIIHARRRWIPRQAVTDYMDNLHAEAEQRRAARAAKKRPRPRSAA